MLVSYGGDAVAQVAVTFRPPLALISRVRPRVLVGVVLVAVGT